MNVPTLTEAEKAQILGDPKPRDRKRRTVAFLMYMEVCDQFSRTLLGEVSALFDIAKAHHSRSLAKWKAGPPEFWAVGLARLEAAALRVNRLAALERLIRTDFPEQAELEASVKLYEELLND